MSFFKKIPFQLGAEILLRSPAAPGHKARTRVIGVLEKEFIMIENPVFAISENISAVVEDEFMVAYLYDGFLFTFKSRFRQKFIKNTICIEYPVQFEIEQLRKGPRIKVNLAASMVMTDTNFAGTIKDLSEEGCMIELPKIISLFKGLGLTLTFTLPNDQLIKDMRCSIMNVKYYQIRKITEIGVTFIEPAEEIAKVRDLVNFCMRFKV